jgi:hypothetical protein
VSKPGRKPRASCIVCRHPHRHEIEAARVAGVSLDAIATKWGVDRSAVWRHCRNHLKASDRAQYLADIPLAEAAEAAAKQGGSILSYLALVRSTVTQQMLIAAGANDGHRTAALAGRAVEVLTAIGKFSGQLSELRSLTVNNSVTFINSPAFTKLEAMLLDRLKAHPAALAAVVEGLRQLEEADEAADAQRAPMIALTAEASANG